MQLAKKKHNASFFQPQKVWADHFEALGTPSKNSNFDHDFFEGYTESLVS